MPASAATWAMGRPVSTRRARRSLPAGVSGALAWVMAGLRCCSARVLALHMLQPEARPYDHAPSGRRVINLMRGNSRTGYDGRTRQPAVHHRRGDLAVAARPGTGL